MTKRMLIDASHAEETRVVVMDGNRLEEFDVETSTKKQLKGNIYLAKVVRVEPSLQAAFVEYGGNRHGFLAFSEIHPDYYQIPVADRQRLLAMQEEEARAEAEEDEDAIAAGSEDERPPVERRADGEERAGAAGGAAAVGSAAVGSAGLDDASPPMIPDSAVAEKHGPLAVQAVADATLPSPRAQPLSMAEEAITAPADTPHRPEPMDRDAGAAGSEAVFAPPAPDDADAATAYTGLGADSAPEAAEPALPDAVPPHAPEPVPEVDTADPVASSAWTIADEPGETEDARPEAEIEQVLADAAPPELLGGESDQVEEVRERRAPRFMRHYKIQEVIRRRQILLVQVVKEERGTKGAALTTYISLAGRYSVLMPNSPRGGGISRKITSAADRRRLKEITAELDLPRGMGIIVRTAGANRPKPEIKRDCEYLLRLWDDIREHTLRSVAPALIYEEASLIKRAIRDVYSRDIDEILVDGDAGWKAARDFMRMLMPTHVRKVQLWRDGGQPLFAKQQVEAQLDAMLSPTVQLRSGGYLVINQTEALVAIDVNSGRSTRERGIEETALRTNLEAAEEVARQLRLRDLAGLIVVDFIDMESKKHNAMVERRLKEALKDDRARIQVGYISHFGLLEMSRQRLRPSLSETSFVACPHCGGSGLVRSTESAALHVLRAIEDEGGKRRAAEILVYLAPATALYILNHKRQRLSEIELRHGMRVGFAADEALLPAQHRIERLRAQSPAELPPPISQSLEAAAWQPGPEEEGDEAEISQPEPAPVMAPTDGGDADLDDGPEEMADSAEEATEEDSEQRARRRRRRRRRGGRRDEAGDFAPEETSPESQRSLDVTAMGETAVDLAGAGPIAASGAGERAESSADALAVSGPDLPDASATDSETQTRRRGRRGGRRRRRDGEESAPTPDYTGPTPADPFGAIPDIFDAIEEAEQRAAERAHLPPAEPVVALGATLQTSGPTSPATENAEPDGDRADEPTRDAGQPDLPAPERAPVISSSDIGAAEDIAGEAVLGSDPEEKPAAPETTDRSPAATATDVSEPDPAQPDAEPAPTGPRPILVDGEQPPVEKKRGWWRR